MGGNLAEGRWDDSGAPFADGIIETPAGRTQGSEYVGLAETTSECIRQAIVRWAFTHQIEGHPRLAFPTQQFRVLIDDFNGSLECFKLVPGVPRQGRGQVVTLLSVKTLFLDGVRSSLLDQCEKKLQRILKERQVNTYTN